MPLQRFGNKTLLVLAASTYQLPVIYTAKSMGLRVVTTDNNPSNPGHMLSDACYSVDVTDRDGVLKIAQCENVDGIIAACTDVAVPTAAYVAERLNLPGCPLESVEILCDKNRFREWQALHGYPVPDCVKVDRETKLASEMFIEKRWIIKPNRSSGSKGVFIIESHNDFNERQKESLSFSPNGTGILEQFIDGRQITCEGILHQGRIQKAWITDRQTATPPFVATIGHYLPSSLSEEGQTSLLKVLETYWRDLGITDGPFDCDAVVGEQVWVLEMTPRLGGNSISALVKHAAGIDLTEYAICQACGCEIELTSYEPVKPTAVVILGVENGGLLNYDQIEFELLQNESWVVHLKMDANVGEYVLPFVNGRNRLGEALIQGNNGEEVHEFAMQLRRRLNMQGEFEN